MLGRGTLEQFLVVYIESAQRDLMLLPHLARMAWYRRITPSPKTITSTKTATGSQRHGSHTLYFSYHPPMITSPLEVATSLECDFSYCRSCSPWLVFSCANAHSCASTHSITLLFATVKPLFEILTSWLEYVTMCVWEQESVH